MHGLVEGAREQRGGRRAAAAAGLQRSGSLSTLEPTDWRGEDGHQRGQDMDLDGDMDDDMSGQRGRRNARQQEQNKQVSGAGSRGEGGSTQAGRN